MAQSRHYAARKSRGDDGQPLGLYIRDFYTVCIGEFIDNGLAVIIGTLINHNGQGTRE